MDTGTKSYGSRARSVVLVAVIALSLVGFASFEQALGPSTARAVIGRPFTPLSYAGMGRRTARRTSRRVVRRHAYAYGAYGYGGAYASTLPAGCAMVNGIYNCGAAAYQPYYDGPNLVYAEVDD